MTIDPDTILLQDRYDPEGLAEAIVDRHYSSLHYLAYSVLGDADEADDAVQESIIRALGRIDHYRPGTNLKAWLSRIVVNQCKDTIRRRNVRRRLASGLEWIFRSKGTKKSMEDKAVVEEARTALWSSVDQLDSKHRLPVILRYVHRLSLGEIAEILGIREGTVSSRLFYACRQLESQLAINDVEDLIAELLNE